MKSVNGLTLFKEAFVYSLAGTRSSLDLSFESRFVTIPRLSLLLRGGL